MFRVVAVPRGVWLEVSEGRERTFKVLERRFKGRVEPIRKWRGERQANSGMRDVWKYWLSDGEWKNEGKGERIRRRGSSRKERWEEVNYKTLKKMESRRNGRMISRNWRRLR